MAELARFLQRRLDRTGPYGLALTLAFAAVAVALGGFVALAEAVTTRGELLRLDAVAHRAVYEAVGPGREGAVRAVTWLGNNLTVTALVVLVAGALVAARHPGLAFRLALASGVGGLVVRGLKLLFERARPVEQVIPATGYSFPSGHAFASTVFYGMLVYLVWRLTARPGLRAGAVVAGVLVVLTVGLSRVYLNVHYLTDVVAGWAAGAAWVVAVLAAVHVVEHGWKRRRDAHAHPAA